MTVAEVTLVDQEIAPPPVSRPKPAAPFTRYLVFGTSVGLAIGDSDLEVALVRARPAGVTVLARMAISNFRNRAPLEWGREFQNFLGNQGEKHLSATVLLPRRDTIVRLTAMPGVGKKDIPGALAFQIDSMHPYGDEDVAFAWTQADSGSVLVGIVRQASLDSYVSLFRDAGIAVAGFTFSASAIHSALRLYGPPPRNFAVTHGGGQERLEIYGESDAKPVFSAEFDMSPARALALANSELRLTGEANQTLEDVLPVPLNIGSVDLSAYAAALAGMSRWRAPYANLLPAERRTVQSRARWIPTLILAVMLLLVGAAWLIYAGFRDRRYLARLDQQIAQVQPLALRAEALSRTIEEHRQRIQLLDDYRKRTQGDIEVLAELTRILPVTAWTSSVDISADSVTFTGEADQAAPLLKLLDSSPMFRNSEFSMGVMRGQNGEGFRIRTYRRLNSKDKK